MFMLTKGMMKIALLIDFVEDVNFSTARSRRC